MDSQDRLSLKRQELYDQVWSTPLTKLAASYNLSDNGLRKICIKMDIPLPQAGYWAKIKYGKKVKAIPLPDLKPNGKIEYVLNPRFDKIKVIRPTNLPEIKIIDDLKNLHPILKTAVRYINGDKTEWMDTLLLNVSENNRNRALRILDAIFKELEKSGYIIDLERKLRVRIPMAVDNDIKIQFDLRERTNMKRIEESQNNYKKVENVFNGLLELRLYIWGWDLKKTFTDNPKNKVEDYLPEFIHNMILGFQRKKEDIIEKEAERREQARINKLAEIAQHKKEEEQRKAGILQNMASQLKIYNSVKELLAQIRLKYESEIITKEKLNKWITWAEQTNENRDPIKSLKFLIKFESK
jgi:hypothetical protein